MLSIFFKKLNFVIFFKNIFYFIKLLSTADKYVPKAFHNTNLHYFVLNNSSWKWPFKNHSLPKISTSNNTDERKDMWNVIVLHMIIFIWTFYSISFWTIYSFLYCLYMHSNSVYYKHSTQNYDIVQSWQSILYVYAFYLQKKHKKKTKDWRLNLIKPLNYIIRLLYTQSVM